MKEALEAFQLKIPNLGSKTSAELIPYFVYFLTVIQEEAGATAIGVARCFELLRITPYSNIGTYFSRSSKRGKSQKFLKSKGGGYQLTRSMQLEVQKSLNTGPAKIETSLLLRGLLTKFVNHDEQGFLQEAIDCYEIGARRAAIILTWLLALHHLQSYTLKHRLSDFNAALAKNTDKRIKVTSISKYDDFSEIPEGKFIELLRGAGIISNDVRKILDVKLGVRNSSAHPASVSISEVKATDFIIDLVNNVVLKYAI